MTATQTTDRSVAPVTPPSRPVVWWAALGALFVSLVLYLLVRWLTSGDLEAVPKGDTPLPDWMSVTIWIVQIAGAGGFVCVWWFVVIRPWRRTGALTWDGSFAIAASTLAWQDLLLNYGQINVIYNAQMVNLGSWVQHIPGFVPAQGQYLSEPLLYPCLWYATFLVLLMIGMNWVMGRVAARRPGWSRGQLVLFAVVMGISMALVIDPFYLRLGLYSYTGTVESLTLFGGDYYQYPIYNALCYGPWLGLTASLRYFRNDKGESVAERGSSALRVSAGRRSLVRVLALVGVLNVLFVFVANLPLAIFGMHVTDYPEKIQQRSYFLSEICGPGTSYACPGERIPITRRRSLHITPDGRVAEP